jgi:hypothetical protein
LQRLGPTVLIEAGVGGKMGMVQGNLQKEKNTNIGIEKVFNQILPRKVRLSHTG